MSALVRAFFLRILRLFYPEIALRGEPLPDGPLVVVANHPNGLLDPLVVRLALGKPVAFLAKSTLFTIPVMGSLVRAFDAIPVYRAKEADTTQNDRTFALCRERLAAGSTIALFPEGISHTASKLAPLKTGAARIALSAGAAVRVVPVGLAYEAKETFRSRASATVGAPIDLAPFAAIEDERARARALTDAIADKLGELVLQADDLELWKGFRAVAAWLGAPGEDAASLEARARGLAAAWRRVSSEDPAAAEDLANRARRFARTLTQVGIRDPLALAGGPLDVPAAALGLAALAALAPIALVGALLSWPTYRSIRPLAVRLARGELDVVGTYKLLAGVVLFPLTWIAEAGAVAAWQGWAPGAAVLALAPLTGLVALRWSEQLDARREVLRAGWLVATRARLAGAVEARRRELAERIARTIEGTRAA